MISVWQLGSTVQGFNKQLQAIDASCQCAAMQTISKQGIAVLLVKYADYVVCTGPAVRQCQCTILMPAT